MEKYIEPVLDVVEFDAEDVITDSLIVQRGTIPEGAVLL